MHKRGVSVIREKRVFVLLGKVRCWKVRAWLLQFPFSQGEASEVFQC